MKYIDAEKLRSEIDKIRPFSRSEVLEGVLNLVYGIIASLQQEQPDNMIQWTGNNLKEVIDFTGKSPRFEEWFKSW